MTDVFRAQIQLFDFESRGAGKFKQPQRSFQRNKVIDNPYGFI